MRAFLAKRVKSDAAKSSLARVCKLYCINGSRESIEKTLFAVKNQISALASKIRRYEVRCKARRENELFNKDKKAFYRSVFEGASVVEEPPEIEAVREFWEKKIWGDTKEYNSNAEWIRELKKSCKHVEQQSWVEISEMDVAAQLGRSMNWKAAGIDGLSNFWMKSAPSCHAFLASAMNVCVNQPERLPDWVVRGRTVLLPKSDKTSDPSQYRPISCLTTFWKCLSGIIGEKIVEHLNMYNILAEEQQGAVKNSYGTKTQLIINKSILEDAMRNRKNLSMLYVDYAKAYDSVPHRWILDVLEIYGVSPTIVRFLAHSMTMWKVNMFLFHKSGEIRIEGVKILRGIFQGDSLSPLLFVLALNPLSLLLNRHACGYSLNGMHISHILYMDDLKAFASSFENLKKMAWLIERYTADIGMEMNLKKCKVINLLGGKYIKCGSVELQSGGVIEELNQDEMYKYLGVEELDGIRHDDMKEKIWKEAKAKLRKVLETELNSRNMLVALNECVLPIISYSFGAINWLEGELKELDVKVRKMLHMYRIIAIKTDVDRLYVPRASGGRGLISVWDSFKATMSRISHVMLNSDNAMLSNCCILDKKSKFSIIKRAAKFEADLQIVCQKDFEKKSILHQARIKAELCRKRLLDNRLDAWKGKPQHGAYLRMLIESNADVKQSLDWLKRCHLSPHTEGYVCAAQEMAIFTKYHEKNILHTHLDDSCRVCRSQPETIFHLLSGCDVLAKREYFTRHNSVCKYVHYKILEAFSIPRGENWFVHSPRDVTNANGIEIIYDQVITTDRPVGANRPDIIVRDLRRKKVWILDISCPCDTNVEKKEEEKVSKYAGLKAELRRMWGADCIVIPVVIGGLGAVTSKCIDYLRLIPGEPDLHMCQKITLWGSERILKNVLARRR